MSFIRPEARMALRQWGVPVALALIGIFLVWRGFWMLRSGTWVGFVLMALGGFACLTLVGTVERAVLAWRGRKGGPGVVIIEEGRISYFGPDDGGVLALDALLSVDIITTSEGPLGDDLFWVLSDETGQVIGVPGGAKGADQLLDRLGSLPGFSHRQVVAAMGSTGDARFQIWRRSGRRLT